MGGCLEPKKMIKILGNSQEMKEIDGLKLAEDTQKNIKWQLWEAIRLCPTFFFFIFLNNLNSSLLPLSGLLLCATGSSGFGVSNTLRPCGAMASGLASEHCQPKHLALTGGQSFRFSPLIRSTKFGPDLAP
jgi:hypothetical protein